MQGIWTHAGAPTMEAATAQVTDMSRKFQELADTKWDREAAVGDVVIERAENGLLFNVGGEQMGLVGRGLYSFCYYIDCSRGVVNELMNDGEYDLALEVLKKYQQKALAAKSDLTVNFRCRTEAGSPVIRCTTSTSYAPFDNHEAFDMLLKALPESAGKPVAFRTSDDGDNMRGNLLFNDLKRMVDGDSEYHLGLSFRNSEVKRSRFEIVPFTFRAVCLNGLIVGFEKDDRHQISIRHVGEIDRELLKDQLIMAIENSLEKAPKMVDIMEFAQKTKVPNPQQTIAFLAKTNGLPAETGRVWWNAWQMEPEETGAGVINGLTRAAQEFDDAERVDLESLAGQLIAPSIEADLKQVAARWDAHSRGAKSFGNTYPEKVEQYTIQPVKPEKKVRVPREVKAVPAEIEAETKAVKTPRARKAKPTRERTVKAENPDWKVA
jgi:Domain of unknown function (DUF932)